MNNLREALLAAGLAGKEISDEELSEKAQKIFEGIKNSIFDIAQRELGSKVRVSEADLLDCFYRFSTGMTILPETEEAVRQDLNPAFIKALMQANTSEIGTIIDGNGWANLKRRLSKSYQR